VTPAELVRQRLLNQRLMGKPLARPADVVRLHLAMQSQDFAGAKWAIGQRTKGASDAQVEASVSSGRILRTHVLRPTWHFVSPSDVRWLLALTAPRIRAFSAPYFRKHGLDEAALKRSRRVLEKSLHGRALTRDELAIELEAAKLSIQGEALSYQLIAAELDGLIVSGPRRGKHHSYVLLDERVPASPPLPRDEALAELAFRYLQAHGPALVHDLAWWAGLTVADAKRGIEANAARLQSSLVDGRRYWFGKLARVATSEPVVHLLPNYDEQLIAYRFRGNATDPKVKRAAPPGIFDGHFLCVDGLVAGGWRRELGTSSVQLAVRPLRRLSPAERRGLEQAAQRYAAFLGLKLELRLVTRR
jgi:hypothetical protein